MVQPIYWGPDMWNLLYEVMRAGNARNDVLMIIYSLQWVLPCGTCRAHMAMYLRKFPPSAETNLLSWVFRFHNQVIHSQGRTIMLEENQFMDRITMKSELLSASNLFDLLLVLAFNYPEPTQNYSDAEAIYKKNAYGIFYYNVHKCLSKVPHLNGVFSVKRIMTNTQDGPALATVNSVSQVVSPVVTASDICMGLIPGAVDTAQNVILPLHCIGKYPFSGPDAAIKWTVNQKRKWEARTGASEDQIATNKKQERNFIYVLRTNTTS